MAPRRRRTARAYRPGERARGIGESACARGKKDRGVVAEALASSAPREALALGSAWGFGARAKRGGRARRAPVADRGEPPPPPPPPPPPSLLLLLLLLLVQILTFFPAPNEVIFLMALSPLW